MARFEFMEDTIAAISTCSAANAGISIVRMSGEEAVSIAEKLFVPAKSGLVLSEVNSHTIHYGKFVFENQEIDEVLISVMRAPNTYTREDLVEVNCHGGVLVTRKILDALIQSGARVAEPGEFTKRAFLNGRLDLSQAEAVIDLIDAKNEYALKASVDQLDGHLSRELKVMRDELLNHTAFIEAALDDPEHMSLDGYTEKLALDVDKYVDNLDKLLKTSENGRIIKEGINTCILGKTNAGKSSLLNILAHAERAIVTDIAGTTRDVLEESVTVGGIQLNLIDTAGIRKTDDVVENIGVNRAKEMAGKADLIIYVVDSTRALDENDEEILRLIQDKKVIVVLNKADLTPVIGKDEIRKAINAPVITTSAKDYTGIDDLEEAVKELFFAGQIEMNDQIYITNARHKNLLLDARKSLKLVQDGIENGMTEDFLTIDLFDAYEKLGNILGEAVEDDLAGRIFARFCMGK